MVALTFAFFFLVTSQQKQPALRKRVIEITLGKPTYAHIARLIWGFLIKLLAIIPAELLTKPLSATVATKKKA